MKNDSVSRAKELLKTANSKLPPIARAMRDRMFKQLGVSSEVAIHAFSNYAQVCEGLKCCNAEYDVFPGDEEWLRQQMQEQK